MYVCLFKEELWELREITDVSIKLIGQNFLQLQHLGSLWCDEITDRCIKLVGQICTQLQYLDLHECWKSGESD